MPRLAPLAATLLMAATPLAAQDIVVSSKIDTEGGLLGNMILLALQDADVPFPIQLDARAGPFGLLDETPQDSFPCSRHRPVVVIGLVRGGRVLHVFSPDLSSRSEQIHPTVPPNRPAGHCV